MAAAGAGCRALNLSGLDKCDLDMTAADVRSWRRSVEDWSLLNMVKDADAVRYIRLLCVPSLQKALDARYTSVEWSGLTAAEAMDGVSKIVLRASNQAVRWSEFF